MATPNLTCLEAVGRCQDGADNRIAPVRLGVLAFGDSITNGGGELQWGVALQSWALWTARALGLAYTGYATDGARVDDVLRPPDPGVRGPGGASGCPL